MKKAFLLLLAICGFAGAVVTPTAPTLNDGCYSITNADELFGFAAIVNGTLTDGRAAEPSACGKLESDIYANNDYEHYGCGFEEIEDDSSDVKDSVYKCYHLEKVDGSYTKTEVDSADVIDSILWTPMKEFSGTFDGQGFTITGMLANSDSTLDNMGFIASVVGGTDKNPVTIKNLTIDDFSLKGHDKVGGLVAENKGSLLIENCVVSMPISSVNSLLGIYVGNNEGSLVLKNDSSSGGIRGRDTVGLAVGKNTGTITAENITLSHYLSVKNVVGGFVGYNGPSAAVSMTNVTISDNSHGANFLFGGFVGVNDKGGTVSITNSYSDANIGDTKSRDKTGGFVGVNKGKTTIVNSYASRVRNVTGGFTGINEDSLIVTNSFIWTCSYNEGDAVIGENNGYISLNNVFYYRPNSSSSTTSKNLDSLAQKYGATSATYDEMGNGTLALLLHYYENGEIWGQNLIGGGYHPRLNDTISTYTFDLILCTNQDPADTNRYPNGCPYYSSLTTYIYTEGVAELPTLTLRGYKFLGWAYADNPDSLITSIGKDEFGDIKLLSIWDGYPTTPPQDEDGCFLVSNISELYGIDQVNYKDELNCIKLTDDIVVNQDMMTDSGSFHTGKNEYDYREWYGMRLTNGIFDGQGHFISGLRGSNFFRLAGKDSLDTLVIRNLELRGSYFTVGGSYIDSNEGTMIIENCTNASTVSGNSGSGGFVGNNNGKLHILNSKNTGKINGFVYQGGFVSTNNENLIIENSYNEGVSAGGFVGENGISDGDTLLIINSYNIGKNKDGDFSPFVENSWGYGGLHQIINSYSIGSIARGNLCNSYKTDNVYYYNAYSDTCAAGIAVSMEDFNNGPVAYWLHNYVESDSSGNAVDGGIDGTIWGQEVGVDPYPTFFGELINVETPSSSSEAQAASSSSVASSSSTEALESSSSEDVIAKSSSSEATAETSSSVEGSNSSSSSFEGTVASSSSNGAITRILQPRATGLSDREIRYFNALGKSAKGPERYRVIFER